MNSEIISVAEFVIAFLILLIITHVLLYKVFKVSSGSSRKFLHVSGGLLSLLLPTFIKSYWLVLILTSSSFMILLVTYLTKRLPSVHKVNLQSFGSIIFPIAVYLCFYVAKMYNNDLLFYLPISLLTISDPAAEWGGKKWGHHSVSFFKNQKTIIGSLFFALTTLAICIVWLRVIFHFVIADTLKIAAIITTISSIAELVSLKGSDNLTVPASALLMLLLTV